MELLEKILDDNNLYNAYKQVYKNKGTSGVDGVTIEELGVYMYKHKEEIKQQIRNLKYKGIFKNKSHNLNSPRSNNKTPFF